MTRRGWAGAGALAALVILGGVLALAGREAVPAAGRGDDPGWLLGPFGEGLELDGGAYIHLERAALLAYAAVLICARELPGRLVAAAIGGLVVLSTLAPPLLSLDVFSYVSYARLEALYELNPYESPPAAAPGDESLAFVEDWRGKVSVYGPLFTLATWPLGHLGVAAAVWSLKALAGISVLAIAAVVARLAPLRGVDPRFAAALVGLNPVVLVHVVGGAHNDAAMVALMTLAVAALLLGREAAGGAGLALATMVKAAAGVLAPFALLGGARRARLALGLLIGIAFAAAAGLIAYGAEVREAAAVAGQNQGTTTAASLPGALSSELGLDLDAARAVCAGASAVALVGLLAWTARGADWIRAGGWGFVALLLGTSYLTPWYLIWPLPLAALARDRALAVCVVALSAFLLRRQVPGLGT